MKWFKILILMILTAGIASQSYAYEYYESGSDVPDIELWVNKGPNSTYYYGEDIAVYFRAEQDCYVVVYDIDPSGEVTVLFPSSPFGSTYVTAGNIYRIPDYHADFGLEVSGVSGTDYVFAYASYSYINPPDFMRYIGYEYGDPDYYDDSYFVMTVHGDIDDFVDYVSNRIARGPYTVTHAKFFIDSGYRHHVNYRYWDPDPYYVGSVWVGCDWPGAEIWIDGIYFGIAPVLIPSIYFGHHWVWVYYGGYPCYQRYFYIDGYQRYYIHVTIDERFRDYRHRRHSFRNWRFHERRYRNEDGFREKAIRARQGKTRTRSLPPSMVLDLHEKGAIRSGAPIVQNAKAGIRSRTERSVQNRIRAKDPEKGKRIQNETRIEKRTVKEERNTNRIRPKKSKDSDRRAKSRYYIKDDDIKKKSGKSTKGYVKEDKKSEKVKPESKKSKSSIKKSDKKSSGSSYKKSIKKSSSSSKSSFDKVKRSAKSSKSSKKSGSDRGKRR